MGERQLASASAPLHGLPPAALLLGTTPGDAVTALEKRGLTQGGQPSPCPAPQALPGYPPSPPCSQLQSGQPRRLFAMPSPGMPLTKILCLVRLRNLLLGPSAPSCDIQF